MRGEGCIPNETITSAIVADGVVDLSTGEYEESGEYEEYEEYEIEEYEK